MIPLQTATHRTIFFLLTVSHGNHDFSQIFRSHFGSSLTPVGLGRICNHLGSGVRPQVAVRRGTSVPPAAPTLGDAGAVGSPWMPTAGSPCAGAIPRRSRSCSTSSCSSCTRRPMSCTSCGWLHPTLASNPRGHYSVNCRALVVNDLDNAVTGNRTSKTGRYSSPCWTMGQ